MDPRDAQCDEAVNRRKYCQLSELEVPIFWRYQDHLLTQCKNRLKDAYVPKKPLRSVQTKFSREVTHPCVLAPNWTET